LNWIYKRFGSTGVIIGFVLIFMVVLSIQPIDGLRTDPAKVWNETKAQYTNVVMNERQLLWAFSLKGCSRDDSAAYRFTGQNINGDTVSGVACVRAFTHKVSFRIASSP